MAMMGRIARPPIFWGAMWSWFILASAAAADPVYSKLSFNADPTWDRVRIFLDAKSAPGYKHINYLSNPARIQVEIEGSLDGIDEGVTPCDDSYLKSIRLERIGRDRIRLTALVAAPSSGASVDFYRNNIQKFVHIDINRPARYQQPTWTPQEVAAAHRKGIPVVVVDPGHGGYDTGTGSRLRTSLREKDVVLDVSKKAAQILRRNGKVYPVMTRSGDCYPTLDERVDLVGDTGAKLLVSIHADSAPGNRSASGFAAWVLKAERGEVVAEARRILKYGWRTQLAKYPISKQNLVISRQAEFVEAETEVAAETLLASLDRNLSKVASDFENRGIKRENLKVLRHYFSPAVLIELGFLSNLSDSRLLDKSWFREKMAAAIAEGIENYFDQRQRGIGHTAPLAPSPQIDRPSGGGLDLSTHTQIVDSGRDSSARAEYRGETVEHVVKRGETLGRLARQYDVEEQDILAASGLPSKRRVLYPGDKLQIPVSKAGPASQQTAESTSTHQVADDDNLLTIALRYGTTVSSLRDLNGWPPNRVPRVGEVIRVPQSEVLRPAATGNKGAATLEGLERLWSAGNRSSDAGKQTAGPFDEGKPELALATYPVQAGDTLMSIANKQGVDVRELRRANGLGSDLIRVGQDLKIPAALHQEASVSKEDIEPPAEQLAEHADTGAEEQTY